MFWSDLVEIRSKIWIEIEGEPVFSKGRGILLRAIDECGSINSAAATIGISYRRAWSYIKAMEERLGVPLVETQVGGKSGGGAKLTDGARQFLKKYEMFEKGINEMVDERFQRFFL